MANRSDASRCDSNCLLISSRKSVREEGGASRAARTNCLYKLLTCALNTKNCSSWAASNTGDGSMWAPNSRTKQHAAAQVQHVEPVNQCRVSVGEMQKQLVQHPMHAATSTPPDKRGDVIHSHVLRQLHQPIQGPADASCHVHVKPGLRGYTAFDCNNQTSAISMHAPNAMAHMFLCNASRPLQTVLAHLLRHQCQLHGCDELLPLMRALRHRASHVLSANDGHGE